MRRYQLAQILIGTYLSLTAADEFRKFPETLVTTPAPFHLSVPQDKIDEFRQLLNLSKVAPTTYEGLQPDRKYGITTEWLRDAKEQWLSFDWRNIEDHVNAFPNYKTNVTESGDVIDIHFVALFSQRKDATPVLFLHGWPGSFLEYLPILEMLMEKYTAETLPYHVIVPSLPGYAFSSPPPLDRDFKLENIANIFDELMVELGFGNGFVVQGGDIGSTVARVLGGVHPRAKAIHLNFCYMPEPSNIPGTAYNDAEKTGLVRANEFNRIGNAYILEHATKPSTIGLALSTNPLALLAWIGEKFLDWTDEQPPMETIFEAVTLYWLTDCFPTSIYPYRELFAPGNIGAHENPLWHINKPLGYSWFPKEIAPIPKAWVETTGDLVFARQHDRGGHFAALERPEVLLDDFEAFVAQVWPQVSG